MKKIIIVVLTSIITSAALAKNCNEGIKFEEFKKLSINNLDKQVKLSSEAEKGFNKALEIFWDFRSEINFDSSICVNKFHIYDHETTLFGFNQNAFTRFPPDTLVARNAIGPGLGFDHSFLELGFLDPSNFSSALKGILVYFEIDKEETNGPDRAFMELNYGQKDSNIFNEISIKVCKTENPINCYNLAMYRLITFELSVKPEKYLKKGSALDFAQLLMARGETFMAANLLIESQNNSEYFELYKNLNPNFKEDDFQLKNELK